MASNKLIIGLTGSFASGCGEGASYLEKKGFEKFSLATKIKEVAEQKGVEPNRENLQNIGDDLRRENKDGEDYDYLARVVSEIIDASSAEKFVVKSFRHHHEVKFFRKKYPSFVLFNIDAPRDIRYGRVKEEYTREEIFDRDDDRDSGENQPEYGQRVRLCVDNSDIVINNDRELNDWHKKIDRYVELIYTPATYQPYEWEITMAAACLQSKKSGCLKRQVGAVITKNGHIIASGYNSTPGDGPTCIDLQNCYRDVTRVCPECGTKIQLILEKCNKCGYAVEKQRLAELHKNLDLCRAIHAEGRAILQSAKMGGGASLDKTTLYTTTFPCIMCAKKIVEVGIRQVWYIDPYPFREARSLLLNEGKELSKFEGVKSKAFDKLYAKQPA
jgi:deoxycytidylate deaminase